MTGDMCVCIPLPSAPYALPSAAALSCALAEAGLEVDMMGEVRRGHLAGRAGRGVL